MREQLHFTQVVLNNSPNIMILTDAAGWVAYVNRAGSDILQRSQDEMVGRSCGEIFHCVNARQGQACGKTPHCDVCPVNTRIERTLQTGESTFKEEVMLKVMVDAGEALRTALLSTSLVRWEDADHVLISILDTTAHKHLEEKCRELEERVNCLENLEALGIMAGGVAHDLNNVFGGVFAYAELLLEKIPAVSPLRAYAENILASGEKGAAIVQKLLTMARQGVQSLK